MFERKIKTVPLRQVPDVKPVCVIIDGRRVTKHVITIAGITLIVVAATPDVVFAADSIDAGANHLYRKLISVGKWVIIIKGGMDCIQAAMNGDFESVKKKAISALLIFGILLGLPWAMDEVENLFDGLEASGGVSDDVSEI